LRSSIAHDIKNIAHAGERYTLLVSITAAYEYLSGAVAAEPLQVAPVCEVAGKASVLQGDARVDEGRGSAVVVHKEVLRGGRRRAMRRSGGDVFVIQCVEVIRGVGIAPAPRTHLRYRGESNLLRRTSRAGVSNLFSPLRANLTK